MSTPTRILVTGGSGFIGTNLVHHFVSAGHEVFNLDIATPQIPNQGQWLKVDIRDTAALDQAFHETQPEIVCHFAARVDLDGRTVSDYDANTIGVANMVQAAKATPSVRRVIFASSQLVCTPGYQPQHDLDFDPPNAYGESKVLGEQLVRTLTSAQGQHRTDTAFSWVLLRPTSIWGPYFGPLYSAFLRTIRDGLYVHPRGQRIHKSFGFVGNAVYQIDKVAFASDEAVHGRVLYLADYEPYPIYEWAQAAAKHFSSRNIIEVPTMALRMAAWGGDALSALGYKRAPLTSYRLRNMLTETIFDLSPLFEIAGDVPFSLEDATRITVEWMNENRDATG